MIKDHQGNEFSSVEEMANHYGLDAHKLFERLQVLWWPVERALTENIDSIRKVEKAVKKIDSSSLEYARPESAQPGTLAYERPDLLEEWDYEKNNELRLDPTKLSYGSDKKAWWTCKVCDCNFNTRINTRAKLNCKCPGCTNRIVTSKNSLLSVRPDLAKEYMTDKNNNTPDNIVAGGRNKAWWKCSTCGYEYQSKIANRVYNNTGCPKCAKTLQTSFPEQCLFYYVSSVYPDAINQYKVKNIELDIYIPSINTAIEYDGIYFHEDRLPAELDKNQYCFLNKIRLIRVREEGLPLLSDCETVTSVRHSSRHTLNKTIEQVLQLIYSKPITVDIDERIGEINAQLEHKIKNNSLGELHPELIDEFSSKNNISIFSISEKSKRRLIWTCKSCGYEWITMAYHRANGAGCPVCSHEVPTEDDNLVTQFPEIAKEYNEQLNEFPPTAFRGKSGKTVWWTCSKCGNNYRARIDSRTHMNKMCPFCKQDELKQKSVFALFPEIAAEITNENIETLPAFRNTQIEFRCSACNKTYVKYLSSRTIAGSGCPYCKAGRHPEFRKQKRYIDENGNLVIEEKE